ncbi:MAG: cation:proton antiporter [Pseudomonadota bacterium]
MDFLPSWPADISLFVAFGLMLIIGAMGGYIAHRVSWIPSITGFMVVGFAFGPSGMNVLNATTIAESRILVDIALALILYRLGLSLDVRLIWRSPALLLISLFESVATFGLVYYVLHWFGVSTVLSLLVAAIAISSSPAVLLHVAHEVGAKGEVTESSKTLVAINNLISFLAFSAVLPALLYSTGADLTTIVAQPLYQLLGSLLLGLVLALALHYFAVKTSKASQYRLALVIGTIMVAIGLAYQLKLSVLLTPMVIGVVVTSLERDTLVSELEFGAAFELFFIVLFVFAGAGLHLHELIQFAPIVLALVLARSAAKILGVMSTSTFLKRPYRQGVSSGLLLVPMAGLAIGLVQTSGALFPQYAGTVTAIVLGAVTVFETIGPPIAAFAFRYSGEDGMEEYTGETTEDSGHSS